MKEDIKGKKIRKSYFESNFLFILVVFAILTVWDLAEGKGSVALPFYAAVFGISCVITALLQFCFGRVCAVLAEDRVYFHGAQLIVGTEISQVDGYVYYSAIQKIKIYRHHTSRRNSLLSWRVQGKGFEILVVGGGCLARLTLKKLMKADPGFAIPSPYVITNTHIELHNDRETVLQEDNSNLPERTGLYGELFAAYTSGEMKTWFEGEGLVSLSDYDEFVEADFVRENAEYTVNFDNETLLLMRREGRRSEDRTLLLAEIADVEAFRRSVSDFLNGKEF